MCDMALVMGKLNDALLAAGVPADLAREASEEVASFKLRTGSLEFKLNLLTWMVGLNVALTAAVLLRLLSA